MNKHLFLYGIAATILTASCSGEDNLSDRSDEPSAWNNSEIPIRLTIGEGTGTYVTRSAFDNTSFNNDPIGVCCLATGRIQATQAPQWRKTDKNSVLLNNTKAIATGSSLTWADSNGAYYYPANSLYQYSFAGYYPYGENNVSFSTDGTAMHVAMALDGHTEVLSSVASSADADAYSARYFRNSPQAALPDMNFDHKLMWFRIRISGSLTVSDNTGTHTLGVRHITLDNVPTTGTLSFTQTGTADAPIASSFTADWANADGSYTLLEAGDATPEATGVLGLFDMTNANETRQLGQGLLVPVDTDNPDRTYTLTFTFAVSGETESYKTVSYSVKSPDSGWQPGTRYNLTLTADKAQDSFNKTRKATALKAQPQR